VRRALERAPRRLVLCDQDGKPAVDTTDPIPRFGVGINCLRALDWRTGENRPFTLADLRETARLCEKLPNIDLAGPLAIPMTCRRPSRPCPRCGHSRGHAQTSGLYRPRRAGRRGDLGLAGRARGRLAGPGRPAFRAGPDRPALPPAPGVGSLPEAGLRRAPAPARGLLPGAAAGHQRAGDPGRRAGPVHRGDPGRPDGAPARGPGSPVLTGSSILPMDLRTGGIAYGSPEYALVGLAAVEVFTDLGSPPGSGLAARTPTRWTPKPPPRRE